MTVETGTSGFIFGTLAKGATTLIALTGGVQSTPPDISTGSRHVEDRNMPKELRGSTAKVARTDIGYVVVSDPMGVGPDIPIPALVFDSYEETAQIIADKEFVSKLRASIRELDSGEVLDWEDVKSSLGL